MEKAFCYRTGEVEFGTVVPSGALMLAQVPSKKVREQIEVLCRRAYNGIDLLVPGVPEAENDEAALKAVKRFIASIEWCLLPKKKRENTTWADYVNAKAA